MEALEIKDFWTEKQFLELPAKLYAEDKNWISPPLADIRSLFDSNRMIQGNPTKSNRWILLDEHREVIGRIAAFYYQKAGKTQCGLGFFECVNRQEAANKLFETALSWLGQEGQTEVEAPVNFGQRDAYWGLLVE